MDLINCKECGKVFASSGKKICPDCRQSEEEKFELVNDYLWENPNSTIKKVSEETGVEKELIIKFMRENRLDAEGLMIDYQLKCEKCGTEIKSGFLCAQCRNKLINDFKGDSQDSDQNDKKEKAKKSDGMFLKDRFKRDN